MKFKQYKAQDLFKAIFYVNALSRKHMRPP